MTAVTDFIFMLFIIDNSSTDMTYLVKYVV